MSSQCPICGLYRSDTKLILPNKAGFALLKTYALWLLPFSIAMTFVIIHSFFTNIEVVLIGVAFSISSSIAVAYALGNYKRIIVAYFLKKENGDSNESS